LSTTLDETFCLTSFVPARIPVDLYHRMLAAGVFDEGPRYELLDGLLVEKMTKSPLHSVVTQLCQQAVSTRLSTTWHVRNQEPVTFDDSEPEPDLAVVRGRHIDFIDHHPGPGDLAIAIEIAESSLAIDRRKSMIFARNQVPHFWIVNLPEQCVECFAEPTADAYLRRQTFRISDSLPIIQDITTEAIPVVHLFS